MIGLKVSAKSTFDRSIIYHNWNKIAESPSKKAGLLIRKIAIQSIRRDRTKRRRKPSKPGTPPRTRASGDPFRKIYSVPEGDGSGAIIGPVGFSGDKPVTELHEKGGRVIRRVFEKREDQSRTKKGRFGRKRNRVVRKVVVYPKRAYMAPALEKAKDSGRLPPLWRNSLSG